uniref:Uncharacterized protein n=1 Tax=uncultured Desulfobacterium sp. TaxID=201089 RepID=E1YHT6_9BACT|nr:unknown protein [uncultured Desulfobacterium sp.]
MPCYVNIKKYFIKCLLFSYRIENRILYVTFLKKIADI